MMEPWTRLGLMVAVFIAAFVMKRPLLMICEAFLKALKASRNGELDENQRFAFTCRFFGEMPLAWGKLKGCWYKSPDEYID